MITLTVCFILLLNFTAPNPTGRRYSSLMPLTTGQASGQQIGLDAELVLANDLGLPRNDEPDQRQCVCGNVCSGSCASDCLSCIASVETVSNYRRPDFIGADFIAESKNSRNLLYESRDFDQISAFAEAAQILDRRLWIYIRVNTNIDPAFEQVVNATGGGVVRYFSLPDYVDPVDAVARNGIVVSGVALGLLSVWQLLVWRPIRFVRTARPQPQQANPTNVSERKLDDAEELVRKRKDRLLSDIDRHN